MREIPYATVKRLTLYDRILHILATQGVREISSKNLAGLLLLTPAQVRKDLSYFGTFGKRGSGYNVSKLVEEISAILGISKVRKLVIIGAGNLGTALAAYRGFNAFGFSIPALFDVDERKAGRKIKNIPCYQLNELEKFVRTEKIRIAVISVPASEAQAVASAAVKSGIRAILNFAPVRLNVPENIKVNDIDMALELKSLAYYLKNKKIS